MSPVYLFVFFFTFSFGHPALCQCWGKYDHLSNISFNSRLKSNNSVLNHKLTINKNQRIILGSILKLKIDYEVLHMSMAWFF